MPGSTDVQWVGPRVVCDICNAEWTSRPESGGFLFGSKAVCPTCAPKFEEDVQRYDESWYIRARCPAGKPFAEWVLFLRGGNHTIKIVDLDSPDDLGRLLGKR